MAAEGGLRGKGAACRSNCPRCERSTTVTWNKRTGDAYYRPHTKKPRVWCVRPGESLEIPASMTHERVR